LEPAPGVVGFVNQLPDGRPALDFWLSEHDAFVLDPDGVNIEAVCHLPE